MKTGDDQIIHVQLVSEESTNPFILHAISEGSLIELSADSINLQVGIDGNIFDRILVDMKGMHMFINRTLMFYHWVK